MKLENIGNKIGAWWKGRPAVNQEKCSSQRRPDFVFSVHVNQTVLFLVNIDHCTFLWSTSMALFMIKTTHFMTHCMIKKCSQVHFNIYGKRPALHFSTALFSGRRQPFCSFLSGRGPFYSPFHHAPKLSRPKNRKLTPLNWQLEI